MNQISNMKNMNMSSINNMDMNGYNIRGMPNSAMNIEEQGYDTNTMDMMNSSMNQSYMMHGAGGGGGMGVSGNGVTGNGNGGLGGGVVLNNNGYPNEYMSEQDKYAADFMSQMKMEQALNSYNNTASMQNATLHELNDSANMHGMNISMDPSVYESYRNMMNYNNTQNTMKSNQMPMHIEDMNNNTNNSINNNNHANNSINNNTNPNNNNMNNNNNNTNNMEAMYYNEQTGEVYSEDFIKNLPTTTDAPHITGYGGNFKMQNDNYNHMMQENYKNMQYPMSVFENMNNPQMFMQHQASLKPKQTRNVSLLNQQQMQAHMMPHMTPSMQPQIAPCTSLRKIAAGNKRKVKPKKFFPCC